MRWILLFLLCLVSLLPLSAAENPHGLPDGLYTEVTTPRGVVVGELFFKKVPLTVANYVGLAEGTLGPRPPKPFYDGLKFHRVVADFVVQGGDPTGTGDGGPGYEFPDEIVPRLRHDGAGTIQMANDGPDTNGSQWCFMLREVQRLNYLHSVFGKVVRGLDVLPKIQQGDTMQIKILRFGVEAKAFKADEETFSSLTNKATRYTGLREPGPTAHFDDPDKILPTDPKRAKHFNFKLTNFERFTGRKLYARVLAKTPVEAETRQMMGYLRAQAEKLGIAKDGVLAVYCADKDEWNLWIGDSLVRVFAADVPKSDDTAKGSPVSRAKQQFLAASRTKTAEFTAYAAKNAPSDKPLTDGQKIKFSVDAVLDGLIFKLEPK